MKNFGALRAIVTAGLIVGVLDISSAFVIWLGRGVGLQRGLQGIAAGLLGTKSYEGGMATAGMGLAIHFLVAFVVVSILFYGFGVYLVMYWFVLPMAFSTFRHRLSNELLAVAIHISLIGLPTAFIVRRYSQPTEQL